VKPEFGRNTHSGSGGTNTTNGLAQSLWCHFDRIGEIFLIFCRRMQPSGIPIPGKVPFYSGWGNAEVGTSWLFDSLLVVRPA
jgi:hypothetical protein